MTPHSFKVQAQKLQNTFQMLTKQQAGDSVVGRVNGKWIPVTLLDSGNREKMNVRLLTEFLH